MQGGTARDRETPREMIRAGKGEKIWVLANPVKADKLNQHEHFVFDILMPAVKAADPVAYRHIRYLHPSRKDKDGNYTSFWLMDPLIEGSEYDILKILQEGCK